MSAIALALIIWYGGRQVMWTGITLGTLVAFIQYTQRFFRPISDLSEKYGILQQAMASSEHCCGLWHAGPLPFLQPAVWRAFDPGILAAWLERFRDLDAPREVAHASAHSRAPPA